jgi:hypothetical protein
VRTGFAAAFFCSRARRAASATEVLSLCDCAEAAKGTKLAESSTAAEPISRTPDSLGDNIGYSSRYDL